MLSEEYVRKLLDEKTAELNYFVVDFYINTSNLIRVEVDCMTGTSINDCVAISRHIEGNLDREEQDFELTVSSAGLDQPLRHIKQFEKNLGKEVESVLTNGDKIKGKLIEAKTEFITLEYSHKVKVEGKKKKQIETVQKQLQMDEIKETKIVISFK